MISIGIIGITVISLVLSNMYYDPQKDLRKFWEVSNRTPDAYGNTGWSFIENRNPYQIILSENNFNYRIYSLIANDGIYGENEGEQGDVSFDIYTYRFTRQGLLGQKWNIENIYISYSRNLKYEEILALVKNGDITKQNEVDISTHAPLIDEDQARLNAEYSEEPASRVFELHDLTIAEFEEVIDAINDDTSTKEKVELAKKGKKFIYGQSDEFSASDKITADGNFMGFLGLTVFDINLGEYDPEATPIPRPEEELIK